MHVLVNMVHNRCLEKEENQIIFRTYGVSYLQNTITTKSQKTRGIGRKSTDEK